MKSVRAAEKAARVLIAAGEPHAAARRIGIVDRVVHDRRRDAALDVAPLREEKAPSWSTIGVERGRQRGARRGVDDLVAIGDEAAREAPQRHAGRQVAAGPDLAVVDVGRRDLIVDLAREDADARRDRPPEDERLARTTPGSCWRASPSAATPSRSRRDRGSCEVVNEALPKNPSFCDAPAPKLIWLRFCSSTFSSMSTLLSVPGDFSTLTPSASSALK